MKFDFFFQEYGDNNGSYDEPQHLDEVSPSVDEYETSLAEESEINEYYTDDYDEDLRARYDQVVQRACSQRKPRRKLCYVVPYGTELFRLFDFSRRIACTFGMKI